MSQWKTNAASTAPSKQPLLSTNAKPHPTAQPHLATNSPSLRRTDGWKKSAISQNPARFTSPITKAMKTSLMPTLARTKIWISSEQWENKSEKASCNGPEYFTPHDKAYIYFDKLLNLILLTNSSTILLHLLYKNKEGMSYQNSPKQSSSSNGSASEEYIKIVEQLVTPLPTSDRQWRWWNLNEAHGRPATHLPYTQKNECAPYQSRETQPLSQR